MKKVIFDYKGYTVILDCGVETTHAAWVDDNLKRDSKRFSGYSKDEVKAEVKKIIDSLT
jgi:formylmethanofuran dehydrogenase subunit E-like metal-binding protein